MPGLSRQRRAGNMSDRAPESGFVDPFDDHRGKEETWDLNAADQAVRPRRHGCTGVLARRAPITQQAVEIQALAPLENPGVHQRESAIAQKQDGAGKERTLGPLQDPPEWLFPQLQASFGALLVKPWFGAGYVAGARAHEQSVVALCPGDYPNGTISTVTSRGCVEHIRSCIDGECPGRCARRWPPLR